MWPLKCCYCYLEHKTLFLLIQFTELGPGELVPIGRSKPPSCNISWYLGKQMPLSCLMALAVLSSGFCYIPPIMGPGRSSGGFQALPQEDLPTQGSSARVVHTYSIASSLGGNNYVSHGCCNGCVCVCLQF